MSISSNTLSSPTSSPSTPNSTPQPCSLHASSSSPTSATTAILNTDQLLGEAAEDEDELFGKITTTRTTTFKEEKKLTTDDDDDEVTKQTGSNECHNKNTSDSKITTTTNGTKSTSDNSSTTLPTKTTTSDTSPSPDASNVVQQIASSSSNLKSHQSKLAYHEPQELSSSASNVNADHTISGSNISQQLIHQQHQQANKWKLAANNKLKLETTCNILSKSSSSSMTSSSKSSTLSRSQDLSTKSATSSNSTSFNFKTRPLLMNHNNHYQHHNQASSSTAANNNHSNAATPTIAPTSSSSSPSKPNFLSALTPQLILSQIISANPAQRSSLVAHQSLATGLEGLQFCLNTTSHVAGHHQSLQAPMATTSTSNLPAASSQLIKVQALMPTKQLQTPSRSLSNNLDGKPKVKLHNQNNTKNQQRAPTPYQKPLIDGPGDHITEDGTTNPSGCMNVAAARLLDLGKKLIEASRSGQVEQVRHLVEDSGAPFTSDWLGTTALHVAAQHGFIDIAEVLVRGGVNRDARTKLDRTALHLAAQSGSLEIVDLLLINGSDVNARDMLKMTPLHWAVERGHVYVAERLMIAGADIELHNKFLLTPIDIARESGSCEMIELFKNWTGDNKDDQNLEEYSNNPEASMRESQDFLDIDYHLAFVNSATNSRGDSMLDNQEEPCIDLVELEWNKIDFDPDLFLPSENEDEPKVEYLMKVVEELQKENQQLRQKVEQLTTIDP